MARVSIYTGDICEAPGDVLYTNASLNPPEAEAVGELSRDVTASPLLYLDEGVLQEKAKRLVNFAKRRICSSVHTESAGEVIARREWEARDYYSSAKFLLRADDGQLQSAARLFFIKENLEFAAGVFAELAHTSKGAEVAGQMLAMMKPIFTDHFARAYSVLIKMQNPAAAARVVNFWQYNYDRTRGGKEPTFLALSNSNTLDMMRGVDYQQRVGDTSYRYEMIPQYLACLDGAKCPDAHELAAQKDAILEPFARYHDSGRTKRDAAELRRSLDLLIQRRIIDSYEFSFDANHRNRIEEIKIIFPPKKEDEEFSSLRAKFPDISEDILQSEAFRVCYRKAQNAKEELNLCVMDKLLEEYYNK